MKLRELTHRGKIVAVAILIPSAPQRRFVNSCLALRPSVPPVRAFADENKAEEWLETLLQTPRLG